MTTTSRHRNDPIACGAAVLAPSRPPHAWSRGARPESLLLSALVALVVGLTGLDHWATYLCLTQSLPDMLIREGNPVACLLYTTVGLIPGLAADTAITLSAIVAVVRTDLLPQAAKRGYLLLLGTITGFAVIHNLTGMETLGVALLRVC